MELFINIVLVVIIVGGFAWFIKSKMDKSRDKRKNTTNVSYPRDNEGSDTLFNNKR